MKVSAETVHQMARLARLRVPTDREDGLASELSAILDHVDDITRWTGAESCSDPSESTPRRDDVPRDETGVSVVIDGEVLVPPIKGAS